MLMRWRLPVAGLLALAAVILFRPSWAAANHADIVIDAATGEILHAHDATVRWYPASLTKMMTLYLTMEKLASGRLKLDDTLTVSAHAAGQQPTRLGLDPGEKISVEDAIGAVIVRSANDAAVVLGERIGGTEDYFAVLMTEKAKQLGMLQTEFWNASGLPHPKQTTTARDMALLAQALIRDFPQYYHFFGMRSITYKGQVLPTYNGLLTSYPGADGLKTGFTCGSGYNLVASAERKGRRLIGVILGGRSRAGRNSEMARLLDAAFGDEPTPGETQLVADLVPEGEGDGAPPHVLSQNECISTPSEPILIRGPLTVKTATEKPGKLPGWGIVFGSYPEVGKAKATLGEAQKALKPVLKAGRPTIVERDWEGVRSYRALIVGLSREEAGAACKHLWSTGDYCLALSPQALNSASAPWR
ncbi:MAG: D-alanyl-D-alanine carboxypeptidase [Rhodospirillaceae bacterium]|nr:D-alanyl-D-alanine carboxypeptidase [Rhodospirillaceae bacterium]